MSKTDQELQFVLSTIFRLHLITQYHVIPVTVMSHQHSVRHLFKCRPVQAQQLIHVVMCLLQNQHQRQHLLRMGMKGEAMQARNLTLTPPALLICSSLAKNLFLS